MIHGFDIDTSFFTGNFPPAASIEACACGDDIPGDDVAWRELLSRTNLAGDSHHFVPVNDEQAVTHVRLNIYPDGGVARLRIYGEIRPDWTGLDNDTPIDLFAIENGGRAWARRQYGRRLGNGTPPRSRQRLGDPGPRTSRHH